MRKNQLMRVQAVAAVPWNRFYRPLVPSTNCETNMDLHEVLVSNFNINLFLSLNFNGSIRIVKERRSLKLFYDMNLT